MAVTLSPLHRADGSATYTKNGYSVIAAINGPVEVQRKDEIPEEAAVDVVLRPANGIGGVREKHLESIVEKALRQVIYVTAHPRTLIQVTLQVVASSAERAASNSLHQSASNLPILPALLQSSILALVSTSLPMTMTLTSTMVAVSPSGEVVGEPDADVIKNALSVHVLAFSSHGKLLVAESEGSFDIDTWEQVYDRAEQVCRASSVEAPDETGDLNMQRSEQNSLESSLKDIIEEKVAEEQRWREGLR